MPKQNGGAIWGGSENLSVNWNFCLLVFIRKILESASLYAS
jgi:hypothetical protein